MVASREPGPVVGFLGNKRRASEVKVRTIRTDVPGEPRVSNNILTT
jgi:hypothetical protein